jgi:hypothetical protein
VAFVCPSETWTPARVIAAMNSALPGHSGASVTSRMRAAKSLHRTQPRPFQVIAKNRRTRRRRLGALPFKSLESPAERVHLVGDERRKNPRRPAAAQRSDRVLKLRPSEPVALEINAAEAVDLKIEKIRRFHTKK